MQPSIIVDNYEGIHNTNGSAERVRRAGLYKNCSTICIVPTRGMIAWRVVQSWMNLASPMNQQFIRMGVTGYEVGHAYSTAIDQILNSPGLQDFTYILTLEEDNMPPADGLLRLIEDMEMHPEYAAIGGLYWTKGPDGQPMIYGNPDEVPFNFRPQPPRQGELVECNGLGMGFTLFRMDLFKEGKIEKPFFETVQRYGTDGTKCYTQDLWFFERARAQGYRFACDCNVLVGHYDAQSDICW